MHQQLEDQIMMPKKNNMKQSKAKEEGVDEG
jgi:hypothetical protein